MINNAAAASIRSALTGTSLEENLKSSIVDAIITTGMAQGANAIWDAAQSGDGCSAGAVVGSFVGLGFGNVMFSGAYKSTTALGGAAQFWGKQGADYFSGQAVSGALQSNLPASNNIAIPSISPIVLPDPTKEEWIVFTVVYGFIVAIATQIYMYIDGRPVTEDSLIVSAMFGLVGVVYLFGVSPFLKNKS